MPRLTKIYTKTGDDGTTALGTRQRVPKDALRVQSYGEIDELNSAIGVALASGLNPRLERTLTRIQNELFDLGAQLAFPADRESGPEMPRIDEGRVSDLEMLIDDLVATIGPLENFILPGGSPGASFLHLARAVCRRAERSLVKLARAESVDPGAAKYLNRLSDALFVMARYENQEKGIEETLWQTPA